MRVVGTDRDARLEKLGMAKGYRGEFAELSEFVFGSGEADAESFDFAEPAFAVGFVDAGEQVVADLGESAALLGVRSQ